MGHLPATHHCKKSRTASEGTKRKPHETYVLQKQTFMESMQRVDELGWARVGWGFCLGPFAMGFGIQTLLCR